MIRKWLFNLLLEAANVIAIRNGTNAQSVRIYNTYTSDVSFERANFAWSSNVFSIQTVKGGSGGSARAMRLGTDGTSRWEITTSGHLHAVTDDGNDVGGSSNRPRDIYCSRDLYRPGGTQAVFRTSAAITSGAGAQTGTLTNAPTSGNPTCWIPINDNGTTRYIPAW